jgi:aspartyl-tRNA(Asn)/glutamyl-tRNA(Gln) amidotransferase subunit A
MTGGSSSGSGAAVAAGLVLAALGTDTGGSVRIPAALCGIVGLRPSQGAVSTAGVFPLSSTLDTVGPMAGSVADTALLWSVLVGRPVSDVPVDGLRVGVVRADVVDQIVPQEADALDRAVAALKSAGFVVGEKPMPELAELNEIYLRIQRPEARAVHAERIEQAPELYEPEVLRRLTNPETPGWEYVVARQAQREHQSRPLGVDLLVLPTVPIEAPPIGARDTDLGAGWTNPVAALLAFNSPWSVLGRPAISVPVGAGSVQLVGQYGGEDQLLAAAAVLAARS